MDATPRRDLASLKRTLRQLSTHLLAFAVVMTGFAALTTVWRTVDYAVYRQFFLPKDLPLSPDIVVVDLPRYLTPTDHADPGGFRRRLADLLGKLAAQPRPPEAVVLDIVFGNDQRAIPELTAALDSLTGRGVRVYAVVDPRDPNGSGLLTGDKLWTEHPAVLYQQHLTGYGHTQIRSSTQGVLSYDTQVELAVADGSTVSLLALPVRVASDHGRAGARTPRSLILALADSQSTRAQTYQFVHPAAATTGGHFAQGADSAAPSLSGMTLLVGSLEADAPQGVPVAGPIVVASALNAQIGGGAALQPNDNPVLVIGQSVVFALLTAAAFALLFQYVRTLQTHPVVTAILSILIATAGLGGVTASGKALGFATPVGLTMIAILLAGLLAWHFALKFLITGLAEGSGKYDVFISYSRQHGDWVVANLLEPLKAMRKADGSSLAIYFDRESISIGEAFTTKYMWAIVDSRYFLPVFSPEYYGKNHCRNEIDLAYKRSVDKRIALLPVALTLSAVPDIYTHLNILIADQKPDFIEDIRKRLLQPEPPPAA